MIAVSLLLRILCSTRVRRVRQGSADGRAKGNAAGVAVPPGIVQAEILIECFATDVAEGELHWRGIQGRRGWGWR